MTRIARNGLVALALLGVGCDRAEERPEVGVRGGRGKIVESITFSEWCTSTLGATSASKSYEPSTGLGLTFEDLVGTPDSGDSGRVLIAIDLDKDGYIDVTACVVEPGDEKGKCSDSDTDGSGDASGCEGDCESAITYSTSTGSEGPSCYVYQMTGSESAGADLRGKLSGPAGWECDDHDNERNPGEKEVCTEEGGDKVDEDCDGLVDDDDDDVDPERYWAVDADEDNYFVDENGDDDDDLIERCEAPVGYTSVSVSWLNGGRNRIQADYRDCCDDPVRGGSSINRRKTEICDNLDNDCESYGGSDDDDDGCTSPDEYIDNIDTAAPTDLTEALICYADNDGDGYGAGEARVACSCTRSEVVNAGDCEPDVGGVYPGAPADDSSNLRYYNVSCADGFTVDCDFDNDGDNCDPTVAIADGGCDTIDECEAEAGGDCDDTEGTVNSSATEICDLGVDAVDENCDGEVNVIDVDDFEEGENGYKYYYDRDGDDHGAESDPCYSCSSVPPTGCVTSSDDCDDDDGGRFPGNPEICTGRKDEDCDDLIDDADDSVSKTTWYADTDGDGAGSESGPTFESCESTVEGYVLNNVDCDDGNPYRSGLLSEFYYNDIDDDCDDATLDCDQDADGDLCDADTDSGCAGSTCVGGDCDDSDSTRSSTATDDYSGGDLDCNGVACDADGDGFACDPTLDPACSELVCTSAPPDCDDARDDVYPDAVEVYYDGLDANCDGNDCDQDGDGANCNPAFPPYGCGSCTAGDDCDDLDAGVRPSGDELCDAGQVDEDCDSTTNEDPGTTGDCTEIQLGMGFSTRSEDYDRDGFGSQTSSCVCTYYDPASSPSTATLAPCPASPSQGILTSSGVCYSTDSSDCDDDEAAIHPPYPGGPKEETVDGKNNDCDRYIPVQEADCDDDISFAVSGLTVSGSVFTEISQLTNAPSDCRLVGAAEGGDTGSSGDTASGEGVGDFSPADCVGFDTWDVESSDDAPLAAYCVEQWDKAGVVISCWGEDFELSCSRETGALEIQLFDREGAPVNDAVSERFSSVGTRSGYSLAVGGDCDDTCEDRSPGIGEQCDGLDNNCSGAVISDVDEDALPSPLDPDEVEQRTGTVMVVEADLDGDSYLECEAGQSLAEVGASYSAAGSCLDEEAATLFGDCHPLCALAHPDSSVERCDGFQSDCDDDYEGQDEEPGGGDGFMACGAWSEGKEDPLADLNLEDSDLDDVYVLVYVPGQGPTGAAHSGDTSGHSGDTSGHSGDTSGHSGDTSGHSGDTLGTTSDTASDARSIETFVPLILPRTSGDCSEDSCDLEVRSCDQALFDTQSLLLRSALGATDTDAADRLNEALRTANLAADALSSGSVDAGSGFGLDADVDPLLELCIRTSSVDYASCAVVRISLDADEVEDETPPGGFDRGDDCVWSDWGDLPQQVTPTVWSRARILESRRRVIEWECFRRWGTWGCSGEAPEGWSALSGDSTSSTGLLVPAPDLSGTLDADGAWGSAPLDAWWMELGRYQPQSLSLVLADFSLEDGSLAGCWGEVEPELTTAHLANLSSRVGGDCADGDTRRNREQWEGPDDPVARYLDVEPDCETCSDELDNDCDGYEDIDDEQCERCYPMGGGCSSSEKDGGGCASADLGERQRSQGAALIGALAGLLALGLRGRRR